MNKSQHINILFVQENLEQTLSQIGYYYIANKSNQTKIIDFLKSFPFFFFDKKIQNILFLVIQDTQIKSYIDSNEDMQELCYIIYTKFSNHFNLKIKDKDIFYSDLQYRLHNETYTYKKIKQNNLHTYIFFIFLLCILFFYYFFIFKK